MLPVLFFGGSKKPTLPRIFGLRGAALMAVTAVWASSVGASASAQAAPALTEEEGTRHVCSRGPDARLAHAMLQQGSAEVTAAEVLANPSLNVQHQRTASGPEE